MDLFTKVIGTSMSEAIQRVESLIEFAKQSALLRTVPWLTVAQHRQFNRFEGDLRGLPGLTLNKSESDFDEVWLQLKRLHETKPPAPQGDLLRVWMELAPKPTVRPALKPCVDRLKLIEIGALPDTEQPARDLSETIALADFPERLSLERQFDAYVDLVWSAWAKQEKERRRSISLYSELFLLSQLMQGNLVDSEIELVWGVGVATWTSPIGLIKYPMLTQLVEISLNESDMTLEIRPRSSEPRLEIESYAECGNSGVAKLAAAAKDAFSGNGNVLNPFEPSTFEPILKCAATFLDPNGAYWPNEVGPDDRSVPKANEHLVVTDSWVVFARQRTKSLFVQDLNRLAESLTSGEVELPAAVSALVTEPSSVAEDIMLPSFRGLSLVGLAAARGDRPIQDLYFPTAYNDEQVQIVQMLEVHDGVVVQGPPGTGKTHTIANVVCHYLAMGKRVLVTSMKDPALAVLRDKLPPEIQPLAISLLTSEADGMKQFEFAITKISAEVQRIDRSAYRKDLDHVAGQIDTLHARIARTDCDIAEWAGRSLRHITVDDVPIEPREAARQVVDKRAEIEWFPDAISIGDQHRPQFDTGDISDLRAARLALREDIAYLGKAVPLVADFPETPVMVQVHRDLAHVATLHDREVTGQVPKLVNNEPVTIQNALAQSAQIANLQQLRQELDNANQPWISSLLAYQRRNRQSEILELFVALKVEIEDCLGQKRAFLVKPVGVPDQFDKDEELVRAVENLAAARSPFGFAGVFGKSSQKRMIERVEVNGSGPRSVDDWAHVLKYVELLRRVRSLLSRWNTLAGEIPLPRIADSSEQLVQAGQALALYEKILAAIQAEAEIASGLKQLIPTWNRVADIVQDVNVLEEAKTILLHHVTRHRLAEAGAIKDSCLKVLEGRSGDVVVRIEEFIRLQLGNPAVYEEQIQHQWSGLLAVLRRISNLLPMLRTVDRVTGSIEASGAGAWAEQLRTNVHNGSHDALLPDNWKDVWRLRRLATYLGGIDGRQELKRLAKLRSELEQDLAKLYKDAVVKRTWLRLAENATPGVRSALEAYRSAVRRFGKGTGVRAGRYRQDARHAAEQANSAIPCWIMPHYRVCESLPPIVGFFDLVIVDEASQSDLSALPCILRARKLLIVGDDKQVSPEGVGLEEDKIRGLMTRFLSTQVRIYRAQMTPERSIYDLFKVVFANSSVMLREHFRCVAPIIEYSKREFYNHELRPLRLPRSSERIDPPLVDVYVQDGFRGKNAKVNAAEAQFIVDEIRRITESPGLDRRSIGVVSLIGNEQALHVMQRLSSELGEEIVTRFQITCGDARTFQGKERDILFLSMVVSPGNATAMTQDSAAQRFNVAASRARDRMYLVRSIELGELSKSDVLRSGLIQHFQQPLAQNPVTVATLRTLCESPFEKEVFDVLVERGYRVIPQVQVGPFRIDMVVEGDNDSRLAIECDGDRYHGPEHWDSDMNRQRILERAGWQFWRCFASNFVLQRAAVVQELMDRLAALDITPSRTVSVRPSIHVESRRVCSILPDDGSGSATTSSVSDVFESDGPLLAWADGGQG